MSHSTNILLGWSYMYVMEVVSSTLFCLVMFSHLGKFPTLDQLRYHCPKSTSNLDNALVMIKGSMCMPSFIEVDLSIIQGPSLLNTYLGLVLSV